MKHIPFESIYREEFEVVEERHGHVSLYPHTEQLPALLRALNFEFLTGLPARQARLDKRGSGFDKYVRGQSALMFCTFINRARKDQLRLFDLPDLDLVTRVAIVQQITESQPLGRVHRFRFYGGDGFFPEIKLSGKRVAFADHVLQRFSQRAPNRLGEDLTHLLMTFFGGPMVSLPVGKGRAFITGCGGSILAFTYKESADEFFITTCLSVNEISQLTLEPVTQAHNLHYGDTFTKPRWRTWIPGKWAKNYYECWQKKSPFKRERECSSPAAERKMNNWHWVAQNFTSIALKCGHGPGTEICFVDQIPGPCLTTMKPGMTVPAYDELKTNFEADANIDWDGIFIKLAAEKPPGGKVI